MMNHSDFLRTSAKLLYVVNDAGFFLSHRALLAKAALEAGYDVHVATPDSERSKEIIQHGFSYHPIFLDRKGINPWRDLRSLLALCRLYKKIQPDLIHHVTIKPVLYGGIAARLTKMPAVIHAITGLGYLFIARTWLSKWLRFLIKCGYGFAFRHPNVKVIFQNDDDRQIFVESKVLGLNDGIIIRGSGVPLDQFKPAGKPQPPVSVLLPSRLLWDKGVGEFIEAARALKTYAGVRFILAGGIDLGNPAAISASQIQAWCNEEIVEWWGFRQDMPAVLSQVHIVCLPSYREGLPRVLIEAAACGKPIVTTDAPGCREIVRDGENGFLVPVRDGKALTQAIARLIDDPSLRRSFGVRGREIVEAEFSLRLVVEQTLGLYANVLVNQTIKKNCHSPKKESPSSG